MHVSTQWRFNFARPKYHNYPEELGKILKLFLFFPLYWDKEFIGSTENIDKANFTKDDNFILNKN